MRVLQLGPYPPPEGGIHRNMLAIRDELLKKGHQCAIIATARSTKITPEPDVYHPGGVRGLIKLLARLDYDVLHLHVGGDISRRVLGLIAACAVFGRGKSVFTLHSGGYPLSAHGQAARPHSVRGFVFRQFSKIIAVNPRIAEVFERYGVAAEKLRVVYPFYLQSPDKNVEIPPLLKAFAEKHRPFLLTVGLLEDTYDLFLQIDAMERVLEKFPGAGLMIVGSGSLEPELRKAIAGKPYAGSVFLAGDVEHKITLHLVERADVLLRTTLFDGDAISVREALHLETPVIATDNGMRPAGVTLIPVRDAGALTTAIEKLAGRERAAKTVKTEDRCNILKVLDIYRELVD